MGFRSSAGAACNLFDTVAFSRNLMHSLYSLSPTSIDGNSNRNYSSKAATRIRVAQINPLAPMGRIET